MHPRIILLSLTGVVFDLLCFAGAAAVLLTSNAWLTEVGPARFWLVVTIVGIGLVPIMYAFERDAVTRKLNGKLEAVGGNLPAWAGVDRSLRTA